MDFARKVCIPAFLASAILVMAPALRAQTPVAAPVVREGGPAAAAKVPPGAKAAPGTPQPTPPGQPGAKPGAKPGEGAPPGDAAKPEAPKGVMRPNQPATPPNPAELKIRPNADGKFRFNFKGQPWLGVLEWLAEISGLSLDWQELPADYLNLRTQREYTVSEARDVINRHLLDRGFTMLRDGEVLTVVNIKKLDPALVPRVSPEELATRDSHEYVKVSFPLNWLVADKAVEEYKPMLSPNHKLTALKSTNRLEAMDAVANLREVYAVLKQEQSAQGQERLVREFKLQYTRAADIQKLLEALLGLDSKAAGGAARAMTPQQMQQQQMEMQMAQQQAAQGKPAAPPKQEAKIHLVINLRENSILANAPPDQMAVIEQAVKTLDIPSGGGQSILKNLNRMFVYRLAAIDPEALVKMLEEMGDLDPTTRLQVDKAHKSVIAHASLADHVTIRTIVQKLDGSDRRFEVVKLRRLEADYVAGTIEFMMGGGEKKQTTQRYNPYYIDFGYGMGGRQQATEDESRKFKVDADVENNRLLLWANTIEMEEVQNLLVKLGEVNGAGGNPDTIRVLDSLSAEEADELMQRLFRAWPSVAPNPLKLAPSSSERGGPARDAPPRNEPAAPRAPAASREKTTRHIPELKPVETGSSASSIVLALAEANSSDSVEDEPVSPQEPPRSPAGQTPAKPDAVVDELPSPPVELPGARLPNARRPTTTPPPVIIGRTPDGRIVISSDDADALDRLEELANQLAPPRRDYKVFHLKYKSTWAYGVALNLKDFFEEKEKKSGSSWNPYYGYMPSSGGTDDKVRKLSKRKPMKFIADSDSHTILVTGADPGQLRTIQELIDLYDVPDTAEGKQIRQTKVVQIRFSKARIIADAVKEVYRDLLSANDPALQTNQQGKDKDRPPERSYTYIYGSSGEDDKKPETPMKFKGLLSIGVDDLSNTLIISSAEGLMQTVADTVTALDMAARPTVNTLQVMKVNGNIDVSTLQQRLQKVSKQPTPPPEPRKQQGQQPGGPQQQQQQNQEASGESVTVIRN